jgi:hypothetical protein
MASTACSTPATSGPALTMIPMASSTSLLELIDWTALPPEIRETIRTLGPLMQEGYSQKAIAAELGLPEPTVARMRRELRDAIVQQCRERLDVLEPKVRALLDQLS